MPRRAAGRRAWPRMPGVLVGTPAYMAPEQLNGERADARADVFAYGVVVYEYACGTHPFDASTPLGLVARVLEGDAPPIADRIHHMPGARRGGGRSLPAQVGRRSLRVGDGNRRGAPGGRRGSARGACRPPSATWWEVHQAALMALYLGAAALAWSIKEMRSRAPDVVGVHRARASARRLAALPAAHLLFTTAFNLPRSEGRVHARETDIDLGRPADCRGPGRRRPVRSRPFVRCGASSPSGLAPESPSRRF